MERGKLLYEGKAKQVYATADPDLVIQHFKDDATAFNAQKRGTIESKGVVNCKMSEIFFTFLEGRGVRTHFVERLSDRDMLVRRLEIVPVEVVVRNIIAGSLAKRIGRPEGEALPNAILEFFYKDDALGDPMINESHITTFGWATRDEIAQISELALTINRHLVEFLDERNVLLVDGKMEFQGGRYPRYTSTRKIDDVVVRMAWLRHNGWTAVVMMPEAAWDEIAPGAEALLESLRLKAPDSK